MLTSRRVLGCAMALGMIAACFQLECGQGGQTDDIDMGMGSPDMRTPAVACTPPASTPLPQPTQLSLLAGGLGGSGYLNDIGTAARFSTIRQVAHDGAGNLYVLDYDNKVIRKVVLASGAVTTLAGMFGVEGSADGIGTAAQFNGLSGLLADGNGNLYVADSRNSNIRKVVLATGAVTTLAGMTGVPGSADGTGSAAQFYSPSGMALDSGGNLYVADSSAGTIRKIQVATGVVTTFAGTVGNNGSTDSTGTLASFLFPSGLALDSGSLYVTDNGNHKIRKIELATAIVTSLAGMTRVSGSADGTGTSARFRNPEGVVADGSGNLYVADYGNGTIRKVVTATGAVTTLAGTAGMGGSADGTGPSAQFYGPWGLALDGSGNLYVGDHDNYAVRKVVTSTGAVSTLAGSAAHGGSADGTGPNARFGSLGQVTPDACGSGILYVTDFGNHTVRQVAVATGAVTTLAGMAGMPGKNDGTGSAARFYAPAGVVADVFGNLYVADFRSHTIRQIVASTGEVTTLAGAAGMTGSTDGTGAAARFNNPNSMALDPAGNLYVSDAANSTLRKIELPSGAVTTLAGTAGMAGSTDGTGSAARFNYVCALAADGSGNLWVADCRDHTIRKVVLSTGAVTTLAGMPGMTGTADGTGAAARFNVPGGISLDGNGNLYIADYNNVTLRKLALSSGTVTTVAGVVGALGVKLGALPGGFRGPNNVRVLPTGDIIILDNKEGSILVAR